MDLSGVPIGLAPRASLIDRFRLQVGNLRRFPCCLCAPLFFAAAGGGDGGIYFDRKCRHVDRGKGGGVKAD